MKRQAILEAAEKCVCGDRDKQYGSPEDSFKLIAQLWSAYLERQVMPRDVAAMMGLMKIARIRAGKKDDNWVDLAGYAACGGEIDDSKQKAAG